MCLLHCGANSTFYVPHVEAAYLQCSPFITYYSKEFQTVLSARCGIFLGRDLVTFKPEVCFKAL